MKIIRFLVIISFFYSCNNIEKTEKKLVFNTKPAETFIEIMEHLFQNEMNIQNDSLTDSLNFSNNEKDLILNEKLKKLFSFPIYESLSNIMIAHKNGVKLQNKEAYKAGFYDLPNLNVDMSSGVNQQWKEWWEKGNFKKSFEFINNIKQQQLNISNNSKDKIKHLLPKNKTMDKNVEVLFCFDGNRGSYTTDSIIVMDMLDFKNYNITNFTNVLAHELHHIVYGNWINSNYDKSTMNEKQKTLLSYQKRILMEGIAQQINYLDYKKEIKDLYFNNELMLELSDDWFNSLREINSSQNSTEYYNSFKNTMWNNGFDRLKKYYIGKIDDSVLGRRPTIDYYISYYLYFAINKNGGKERLDYVINNPESLLNEYNTLRKKEDLIPLIPDDIKEIWENNLIKQ